MKPIAPFKLAARTSAVTALAAFIALLASCAKSESDATETGDSIQTVAYTVRGVIAQLPDPQNPTTMFMVRHESMPHYRRPDGDLGMNSMTMPFPPADGVSLDGWSVGDQIELAFEVDYDANDGTLLDFRATGLVALPEGVQLDFSPLP